MKDLTIFGVPDEVAFWLMATGAFPWVFLPAPVGPITGMGVSALIAWIGGNHSMTLAFTLGIGQNVIALVIWFLRGMPQPSGGTVQAPPQPPPYNPQPTQLNYPQQNYPSPPGQPAPGTPNKVSQPITLYHGTQHMEWAKDIYFNRRFKIGNARPASVWFTPNFNYAFGKAGANGAVVEFRRDLNSKLTEHYVGSDKHYIALAPKKEDYSQTYFEVPGMRPVAIYDSQRKRTFRRP